MQGDWDRSAAPASRRRRCVRQQVIALRQATNHPYNLNFFVHLRPHFDPEATGRMRARLAAYFDEFGIDAVPEPKEPFPPFDEQQLDLAPKPPSRRCTAPGCTVLLTTERSLHAPLPAARLALCAIALLQK